MTKIMTAAAALLLGVALAATAQANNMTGQNAAPTNNTQSAQTGTTAAPQVTKQRTSRIASKKATVRRHLAAKPSGKMKMAKLTKRSKLQTASLKRHSKLQIASLKRQAKLRQMARLHRRNLSGEQSTAIGSSTMPSTTPMLNTPPATNAPMAGSGSSLPPQGQTNTLLPNQNTTGPLPSERSH